MRNLPVSLHPHSEHLLDWFHISMRRTVLGQLIKGLIPLSQEGGVVMQQKLEGVKWSLWHGKVDKALERLGESERLMGTFVDIYPRFPQLAKAVQQFRTYLKNNRRFLPN